MTLAVNARGSVVLSRASAGGTTVGTTLGGARGAPAVTLPVILRLVRTGTSYVGSYSTDDGTTWTTVGTADLPVSAAAGTQDAGVFHASGSTAATEADFTDFSVS